MEGYDIETIGKNDPIKEMPNSDSEDVDDKFVRKDIHD